MMKETREVVINGTSYVPKGSEKPCVKISGKYVIVRTYSAGVFFGIIAKRTGQEVVMKNARRIWYWKGAASLSQLAIDGTSTPSECKFPVEVPEVTLLQVIEIIPCTDKAVKSINEVAIWKM